MFVSIIVNITQVIHTHNKKVNKNEKKEFLIKFLKNEYIEIKAKAKIKATTKGINKDAQIYNI